MSTNKFQVGDTVVRIGTRSTDPLIMEVTALMSPNKVEVKFEHQGHEYSRVREVEKLTHAPGISMLPEEKAEDKWQEFTKYCTDDKVNEFQVGDTVVSRPRSKHVSSSSYYMKVTGFKTDGRVFCVYCNPNTGETYNSVWDPKQLCHVLTRPVKIEETPTKDSAVDHFYGDTACRNPFLTKPLMQDTEDEPVSIHELAKQAGIEESSQEEPMTIVQDMLTEIADEVFEKAHMNLTKWKAEEIRDIVIKYRDTLSE